MGRAPAIGRADLLRLQAHGGLGEVSALLLGFQGEARPEPEPRPPELPLVEVGEVETPAPEIPVFAREIPRLTFLAAVEAETLEVVEERRAVLNPITDEQLSVRWGQGPALPPLLRWPRLGPWLKQRLGRKIAAGAPDLGMLVRRVARGEPLREMPRRSRTVWAPQAVLIWDVSREFAPYQEDARVVTTRLRRERGAAGLEELKALGGPPAGEEFARFRGDAPVLGLSHFGVFGSGEEVRDAWRKLAETLRSRGHPLTALHPGPRSGWDAALAARWPTVAWDGTTRLPRRGGMSPRPAEHEGLAARVEELLDLLAPAGLVQRPLLRRVRRLLGLEVAAEALAWFHPDCVDHADSFEFELGPGYHERLAARRRYARRDAPSRALVEKVDDLIREQQRPNHPLLAAETELLLQMPDLPESGALGGVRSVLARVVDRLRQAAAEGGGMDPTSSRIAEWLAEYFGRTKKEILRNEEVATELARACALAKVIAGEEQIEWPEGLDVEEAIREWERASREVARVRDSEIALRSGVLVLNEDEIENTALARLRSGRSRWHLRVEASPGAAAKAASGRVAKGPGQALVKLPEPTALTLQTDLQRIRFQAIERPAWARRMWQDRFGLAAEFRVGEVPFVLRWIPPGRFRMGSPEGEVGRYENEGPEHEVSITRGFWLGETPVTEAQWEAVQEASKSPARKPEQKKAQRSDRPQTDIDWDETDAFCSHLRSLTGLAAALPTEAQWEYACRAGTQAAFYDGSPCTQPEGKGPALDRLGWFHENAGGQMQPVKGKQPNRWGLFDMLGNILEWCADWQGEYPRSPQADPRGDDPVVRAVRGGSWGSPARDCRCACRDWFPRPGRRDYLGLRLAAGHELQPAEPGDRKGGAGVEGRDLEVPGRSRPERVLGEIFR